MVSARMMSLGVNDGSSSANENTTSEPSLALACTYVATALPDRSRPTGHAGTRQQFADQPPHAHYGAESRGNRGSTNSIWSCIFHRMEVG
jgi:hypothetical protein